MNDNPAADVRIATITVTRDVTGDRDLVTVQTEDTAGDTLPLIEALGMLRFAEDSVIRDAMGETP